jgi:hypothetical protein
MRSIRVRLLLSTLALLALAGASASAGGKKTHLGVPVGQILNLSTQDVPNDNTGGHTFSYDYNGPPFVVPQGYSFVTTDIQIIPAIAGFSPTDEYLTVIYFDAVAGRFLPAAFLGAHYNQSFEAGFVMSAGTSPTVSNTSVSANPVVVQLQGYLVKGTALPPKTAF